jgi:hypothetical protein
MIYNHTLNLVESPMSLLRASKQMRAEVQALIFDSTRRLLVVMRPKGLWVSPNSVFRTTRKARELDAKSALPLTWYLSDLKVPSTLGFRRALLAFVRGMDVRECAYADIDMRVGTVRILGDNVENHSFEFGPPEDGFCSFSSLTRALKNRHTNHGQRKGIRHLHCRRYTLPAEADECRLVRIVGRSVGGITLTTLAIHQTGDSFLVPSD